VIERIWQKKKCFPQKKLDIVQHPPEETDHPGVRIFGSRIPGQGTIDNHEPVGFPLVYLELEVLVRGVEFLREVINSIDRARLVTGTVPAAKTAENEGAEDEEWEKWSVPRFLTCAGK